MAMSMSVIAVATYPTMLYCPGLMHIRDDTYVSIRMRSGRSCVNEIILSGSLGE